MDDRQDKQPTARDDAPEAAAPASDEQVAELRKLAAGYKEQADRNWQQFLHAAADLENYKKQAARLREDAGQRTRQSLLAVILDVADGLKHALEHSPTTDPDQIVAGILMSHRKIVDVLASLGGRPMNTKGQMFDPRSHEAVDVVSPTEHGGERGASVGGLRRGDFIDVDA